jgi:hypothetical protein
MKNIGQHIVEHYVNGKLIGVVTNDGQVASDQIGYENRTWIKQGTVNLKKKHTATEQLPIMCVRYNLQGR